jgi:hypothetical protein
MLDDTELAYLAGVIDSDGCITITCRKIGNCLSYREMMTLTQVSQEAVDMLHNEFGGSRSIKAINDQKPLYVWQATTATAAACAEALLPYLRIKKRQAELLLMLSDSKLDNPRRHGWQGRILDNETIDFRQALMRDIRSRNNSYYKDAKPSR